MGGPIFDCLHNPLGAVRILFENATKKAASPEEIGRGDWGVKELFDNWIAREGNLERVPELNAVQLQHLAPGSLVRYRGMSGSPASWHTCKYRDVCVGDAVDDQSAETQIWDRKLLYCVPVPGESWVRGSKGNAAPLLATLAEAPQREKREREEECGMCRLGSASWWLGSTQVVDGEEENEDGEEERKRQVPRLHCLTFRSLGGRVAVEGNQTNEVHSSVRYSLLSRLSSLVGGDKLSAEALLLHMIARVHLRSDPLAIGKLSLNLFGFSAFDPTLPRGIASAMALLLPRAHRVGLTLPTLNSSPFAPRKDYASDRLATGVLQLADGTHLTLDETEMESGQLAGVGLGNLESLRTLMQWQKVEYDFEYYKVDMPADIPMLVLSHARSRLLPADMAINVKPVSDPLLMSADEPELPMWRQYLSSARYMDHNVPPGMQEVLEQELVAARREDRSLGPETFHRWLTLARLQSLSYGEGELKEERWREVRELETMCEARLRVGL